MREICLSSIASGEFKLKDPSLIQVCLKQHICTGRKTDRENLSEIDEKIFPIRKTHKDYGLSPMAENYKQGYKIKRKYNV